jgi:inorganic pyrophosphatase
MADVSPNARLAVEVFVEIPRGSRNKYEYDHRRGLFVLDRVLYSSVHYPTDYGYIPDTLALDGDHLDALVVVNEPTFPGCVIESRPIGVLHMRDEKGDDSKILGVPIGDPRLEGIADLAGLSPHWLLEIENFFATYKTLQGLLAETLGWEGVDAAWSMIDTCRRRYLDALTQVERPEV